MLAGSNGKQQREQHRMANTQADTTDFSEPEIDLEQYHKRVAERYIGTPCDIREQQEYPYDCARRELEPNANVIWCVAHSVWWIRTDNATDEMRSNAN